MFFDWHSIDCRCWCVWRFCDAKVDFCLFESSWSSFSDGVGWGWLKDMSYSWWEALTIAVNLKCHPRESVFANDWKVSPEGTNVFVCVLPCAVWLAVAVRWKIEIMHTSNKLLITHRHYAVVCSWAVLYHTAKHVTYATITIVAKRDILLCSKHLLRPQAQKCNKISWNFSTFTPKTDSPGLSLHCNPFVFGSVALHRMCENSRTCPHVRHHMSTLPLCPFSIGAAERD